MQGIFCLLFFLNQGIKENAIKSVVNEALEDVDLVEKADAITSVLSGDYVNPFRVMNTNTLNYWWMDGL